MTPPPEYFVALRLYRRFGWETLPMGETRRAIQDVLTDSFDGADGMAADLATVRVWHVTADCAPRDVTEDVLREIGRMWSDGLAEDYPVAFLPWASLTMDEAISDMRAAERTPHLRADLMGDAA